MNIESLLFQQVEKPKNYFMTKSINVYDDKYRINIYCESIEDNLIKRKIQKSYFASYNDNELKLLS